MAKTERRAVPVVATPEGFWCCPSPAVFQKNSKRPQPIMNQPSVSDLTREQKQQRAVTKGNTVLYSNEGTSTSKFSVPSMRFQKSSMENFSKEVVIEFGDPTTSDLNVILHGKPTFWFKLKVHKNVLMANSSFFSNKISEHEAGLSSLEVGDCGDIDIYAETIGLMYCGERKQQLISQSVTRVLRIVKVADRLGFDSCVHSCLEFLEAVPWSGEEEEQMVISSVLKLRNNVDEVASILKRIFPDAPTDHTETLWKIIDLVLSSKDERSRREMKNVVVKLLAESNSVSINKDKCNEILYRSCRDCVSSLLVLFRQADGEDSFSCYSGKIGFEADNLTWLLDMLGDRRSAGEFSVIWANQRELSSLHAKMEIASRYHVSLVTAKLVVEVGKGRVILSKENRKLLLDTWLQPLMDDYCWLQHGCRVFDRKEVEDGIGRTILTLSLHDQQTLLLGWLESFLKSGYGCPSLRRAFEFWWRRTFVETFPASAAGGGRPALPN